MNALTLIALAAVGVWILTRDKSKKDQEVTEGEQIPPLSMEVAWNENAVRNPAGGRVYNQPGKLYVTNNTDAAIHTSLFPGYPNKVRNQMGTVISLQESVFGSSYSVRLNAGPNNPKGLQADVEIPAGGTVEVPITFNTSQTLADTDGGKTTMFTNIFDGMPVEFIVKYQLDGYEYSELITTMTPEIEP